MSAAAMPSLSLVMAVLVSVALAVTPRALPSTILAGYPGAPTCAAAAWQWHRYQIEL